MLTRRIFLGLCGALALAKPSSAEVPGDNTRQKLNPWRLDPVDLRLFIRLGVEHIYAGGVNPKRNYLPLVRFNLTNSPTYARHEYWGSPHMVGRFLDALAQAEKVTSVPHDEATIAGLRTLLHASLDNPYRLPFDTFANPKGQKTANLHNCREVLQGLVALTQLQKCEQSLGLAHGLVRAMERATRETGAYPAHILGENGWHKLKPGMINYTTGRAIGGLVEYYRASGDDLAIDLARRFADYNIKHTFSPSGELTEASGTHLHSSEGTMASLLDLGATAGEKRYLDFGRLLYDVGLRKWRTSWGWAKENKNEKPGRGEANNTGDFVEAALTLAQNGHPEYFHDAECFVRNGLLASQIINTDWIPQSDKADTKDYLYANIRKRARGAFAFTTPNGYHSYNTDLIGGSLRALCKCHHAAVTSQEEKCQINMLFTVDTPTLTLTSSLPKNGQATIRTKQPSTLSLRLPDAIQRETLQVHVNGALKTLATKGDTVGFGKIAANTSINLGFNLIPRSSEEKAMGWPNYHIEWMGNTIISMSNPEGSIALY